MLWNIPQFIEIDLAAKRLQTTAASGVHRATEFTTLLREEGHIYIQGIEGGRAFSFVIHEASGELNAARRTRVVASLFGRRTWSSFRRSRFTRSTTLVRGASPANAVRNGIDLGARAEPRACLGLPRVFR